MKLNLLHILKINEQYNYVLTYVLFLDKLCVNCESFKAIE